MKPTLVLALLLPWLPAPGAVTPQEPAAEPPSWHGTLLPAAADCLAIEIWPEQWSGEWLLLEVAPHGSRVSEGQLIARFEPRPLREAIERAEFELEAARQERRLAEAREGLDAAAQSERLEAAASALEIAREELRAWGEFELPQRQRQAALADQYATHGIQDQEDELAQLEAMYGADELTDATEEIVLMRSRRDLQRSREQLEMARQQRAHTAKVEWAHEDRQRHEAFLRQEADLARQSEAAQIEAAARRARAERAERELRRQEEELARLRADARFLELRAPRGGLLLHGALADYGPGGTPLRHARGDRAPLRRAAFTLAGGGLWEVALEVGEAERGAADGAAASVRWAGRADAVFGRLEVDPFPTPRSAGADESRYLARVTELGGVERAVPGIRVEVRRAP